VRNNLDTTKFSDEFVAAVVEIARIFVEPADFRRIVVKTVGDLLTEIIHDPDKLIAECENRQWDDRLEAAAVAQRVLAKIGDDWAYPLQPASKRSG